MPEHQSNSEALRKAFDHELGAQVGVYLDGSTLRLDVVQILRAKGIEPTPEAVEISARNLQKAAAELGLDCEIVEDAR